MTGITEAKEKVVGFCKKELKKSEEQLHLLKVAKSSDGWEAKMEITEVNEYLKKMGYPTVYDKNVYEVKLDSDLNVVTFCKEGEGGEEE